MLPGTLQIKIVGRQNRKLHEKTSCSQGGHEPGDRAGGGRTQVHGNANAAQPPNNSHRRVVGGEGGGGREFEGAPGQSAENCMSPLHRAAPPPPKKHLPVKNARHKPRARNKAIEPSPGIGLVRRAGLWPVQRNARTWALTSAVTKFSAHEALLAWKEAESERQDHGPCEPHPKLNHNGSPRAWAPGLSPPL